MRHPPTPPGEDIQPAAPPSNPIIDWDMPAHRNPSMPRVDDESKDPTGFWSVGGSTTVSLSGNQGYYEDTTLRSSFSRHFRAEVDTAHTDVILIICGFVSGLVDGLSFNAWGSFASMQTGIHPLSFPAEPTAY